MLDNLRFPFYLALGFVFVLLFQNWQQFNEKPAPIAAPEERTDSFPGQREAPEDLPDAGIGSQQRDPASSLDLPDVVTDQNQWLRVETDTFVLWISPRGGDIKQLDLPKIPFSNEQPDKPFSLFTSTGKDYNLQSGLLHDRLSGLSAERSARLAPSHHALFQSRRQEYRMENSEDTLTVPLFWRNDATGVEVVKRYVFNRGKYLFSVEQTVKNLGNVAWTGRQYRQLRRAAPSDEGETKLIYTYTGPAYYDGKYHKVSFDDINESPLGQSLNGGWAAMLQHYFLSALIPAQGEVNDLYTKAVRGSSYEEYIIGMRSQPLVVRAGESRTFSTQIYAGPKLQNRLEEITEGLELSTDYGIFSVFSKPLFWLLDKIHSYIGNWGWSIILLTFIIKLLFYKLSETSYRAMAKMKKFQPRVSTLRERFKDDRSRLQQEIMELYKREKVNPLSGCLPILVQIPVFIALYWVLLESVELRQAPFVFWIQDLATRDPYFVLPLMMGVSMFAQQKMSPAPPDPMQAKIMTALPIVFTVFFAFFPAGLVLYWLSNNLLSIAQQSLINRRVQAEEKARDHA